MTENAPTKLPSKRVKYSKEIEKLQEELKMEKDKSIEYLNRLKYLQADFENYRKRVEKEFEEMTLRSNVRLIANLLSILDDLERAIETGKTTQNIEALLKGVEMVYKNLQVILEHEGLVKIEAVGKPFNPNIHEVLVKVPTETHDEGIIVEEARKGFMFKGKVIRPSIVNIACKAERSETK